MTDIPENILSMARAVASEHGLSDILAIARGIQAERARCVNISQRLPGWRQPRDVAIILNEGTQQ